ncbi:hypothetical protein CALVIDRAFT_490330, partial [Calocera viscosa TUFC12733]
MAFKELAARTGYNDIGHVERFKRGLNRPILDKIFALAEMPETFDGWCKYASRFDNQWRQYKAEEKASNPQQTPKSKPFVPKASTPVRQNAIADTSTPMDIDKNRKEIRCFNCGQKGHIKRNCPT